MCLPNYKLTEINKLCVLLFPTFGQLADQTQTFQALVREISQFGLVHS